MPRTPPYCRANPATPTPTAPSAASWPLIHATTILPDPRYTDPEATEQARRLTESIPRPDDLLRRLAAALPQAAPDPARCTGPRADTCTQATTGPCLPRVCPGCLSSDTAETYHHHCHGKAAAPPSTCTRPQATEATEACQGGAASTHPKAAAPTEAPDPDPR